MGQSDFQAEPPEESPPLPRRRPVLRDDQEYEPNEQRDPVETFIPYRNPMGLTAYYLGVFSWIPILGLLLGPAAFVTGILGLRYSKRVPRARGAGHAITGIICGAFTSLLNWGVLIFIVVAVLLNKK